MRALAHIMRDIPIILPPNEHDDLGRHLTF
jgi:hypothetical protein